MEKLNEEAREKEEEEADCETSDEEKNSKHSSDEEDGEDDTEGFPLEEIRRQLENRLHIGLGKVDLDEQRHPHVLDDLDLDGIIEYIKQGAAKNVIVMAGAGISTSAGIPDFRSPGSGLYDNLEKYDLPHPSAVFDIRYFEENPKPFFVLAKELYPENLVPTPTHSFIRLLEEKNLLLRHYTQNIDTLERLAGVSEDKIVEAHGTFHSAHCIKCNKEYSQDWIREKIFSDEIPKCESCQGVVKPDIVFFGEALPARFFSCVQSDFKQCDLLIIMGSSLLVQPFASLIDQVSDVCPRLLINKEKAGIVKDLPRLLMGEGLQYENPGNYRDVYQEGDTDSVSQLISEKLGWQADLQKLREAVNKSK